ncbi:unnamed protein product [Rotaria sp. Silwood2]|nr:unnamed protein product [Rotaria sp. Silwood2]
MSGIRTILPSLCLSQLRPYSLQDSRTIEYAWQQHEEEVQLVISTRHYLIDLQQLQQINEETNQARFIKRIVTPDTTETTTTATTDSIDESTNSSRQSTATTTTNNSSDARTEMMKDNIELYSSFIQSLFSVLYEVYNSSAGPAVKHRCLQAILRMIYYCPSDLLEIILKQQSISSHIASMLASSDYKIVASALQMAEILMKKLPQIFSIYFYREGVVHQIEILIGFGILSSSSSSSSSNTSLTRHNHTSGSHSQLDLVHLNDNNSSSHIESLDEQLRKTNTRRYYTTTEIHPSTRIETRSQRARVPKTSTRSMFEEFSSRPILNRATGASFSTGTLDIGLGRGRPTRGHVASPTLFRPTSNFDPSTYYPRPPIYVPSPYAYASSVPTAASLINPVPTTTTQRQTQLILSSQEKAKLKEWIQNQAKHFRTAYFSNNSSTSNIALQIINRLATAVDILHVGKDQQENGKALRDIANIIAKGDVSPFEMVHSGLITKLFQYLTDDITIPNNRSERLKQFLNIFMNIPLENEQDYDIILKQYIIELYQSQFNHGKNHHRKEYNILNHLINKLHGCINQLEQFPIRNKDTMHSEYVDTRNGLYPAPLGRNAKASVVTKIRQKFKFLGKFMAKALMDSRMIDMQFSIVFYKWLLGQEETLNLEDLIHVDINLYEQFKKLQSIINIRNKLMTQHDISNQQLTNKLNNKKNFKSKDDSQIENLSYINMIDENDDRLLFDGCKISDLSLVFTLPGYSNIDLKKGGKDCLVTIENLDQYINLIVYWTLVEGVRRQFESFRDGFNSIFPIQHLKCFYPDELHQVFCGSGSTELWDLKVLVESTRCDHGYNLNSRAVKWLFDIMINFDVDEQRAFLQFVTGSPRLPVGGQFIKTICFMMFWVHAYRDFVCF